MAGCVGRLATACALAFSAAGQRYAFLAGRLAGVRGSEFAAVGCVAGSKAMGGDGRRVVGAAAAVAGLLDRRC